MSEKIFPSLSDKSQLESGNVLAPRFNGDGLVTAVVTDTNSGEVLMVAHMNAEALKRTLETGQAWYWSRTRGELWLKGGTSGEIQMVDEIRVDCDQDAIWLKVRPQGHGAACHTGRRSCFYRRIDKDGAGLRLVTDGGEALFDPETVYGSGKSAK
ncbi:MAG: phosphoribosyl-AMP cyclohydrolase [Salaquimonas sp.]|jgi:phosphoribosyl-AMP cyclohydrolase|nr:phosphoribosyl-AMP cyclohydrolase [Salaquimonas sp.]